MDTHALLWALQAPERLRETSRQALVDPSNRVVASVVSVWEISIKRSLGKLDAPAELAAALRDTQIEPLPIGVEHAERVATLPFHHKDPFDRLLVAQALVENLVLVTRDAQLAVYGIRTMAA